MIKFFSGVHGTKQLDHLSFEPPDFVELRRRFMSEFRSELKALPHGRTIPTRADVPVNDSQLRATGAENLAVSVERARALEDARLRKISEAAEARSPTGRARALFFKQFRDRSKR